MYQLPGIFYYELYELDYLELVGAVFAQQRELYESRRTRGAQRGVLT